MSKKDKRLCCCPKVNKVHYRHAHKKAESLDKMMKGIAYRVGVLSGLRRAATAIQLAIEEEEAGGRGR